MHMTRADYTQGRHCCMSDHDEPRLTLELMDGGGGEYLVLTAEHWSFNDAAEIDAFCEKLKAMQSIARTE